MEVEDDVTMEGYPTRVHVIKEKKPAISRTYVSFTHFPFHSCLHFTQSYWLMHNARKVKMHCKYQSEPWGSHFTFKTVRETLSKILAIVNCYKVAQT